MLPLVRSAGNLSHAHLPQPIAWSGQGVGACSASLPLVWVATRRRAHRIKSQSSATSSSPLPHRGCLSPHRLWVVCSLSLGLHPYVAHCPRQRAAAAASHRHSFIHSHPCPSGERLTHHIWLPVASSKALLSPHCSAPLCQSVWHATVVVHNQSSQRCCVSCQADPYAAKPEDCSSLMPTHVSGHTPGLCPEGMPPAVCSVGRTLAEWPTHLTTNQGVCQDAWSWIQA